MEKCIWLSLMEPLFRPLSWRRRLTLLSLAWSEPGELLELLKLKVDAEALEWTQDFAQDWLQEQQRFGFVFWPEHPKYPPVSFNMETPPAFVYQTGLVDWTSCPRLAVVGSREPHTTSLRWMESELTDYLNAKHVIVISGGARGVDQLAQSLALRAGRPVVVVLPSGLSQLYPRELESWRQNLLDSGGTLLSAYPAHHRMRKHHFRDRNSLIAALAEKVLVVQAARKSGSKLTGQIALHQGVWVGAIPFHPSDIHGQGNIDLICEGANLVHDSRDLYR